MQSDPRQTDWPRTRISLRLAQTRSSKSTGFTRRSRFDPQGRAALFACRRPCNAGRPVRIGNVRSENGRTKVARLEGSVVAAVHPEFVSVHQVQAAQGCARRGKLPQSITSSRSSTDSLPREMESGFDKEQLDLKLRPFRDRLGSNGSSRNSGSRTKGRHSPMISVNPPSSCRRGRYGRPRSHPCSRS
jgi:hypothetical protein